jgi:hypothetical protein
MGYPIGMARGDHSTHVIAGLDPAIHLVKQIFRWMRGSGPRMTIKNAMQ